MFCLVISVYIIKYELLIIQFLTDTAHFVDLFLGTLYFDFEKEYVFTSS